MECIPFNKLVFVFAYRDGRPLGRSSRRQAVMNKETDMHQAVIPRTQKIDHHNQLSQREYAAKLAPLLIEKLERVRRERETQELLKKKLTEVKKNTYIFCSGSKLSSSGYLHEFLGRNETSLCYPRKTPSGR